MLRFTLLAALLAGLVLAVPSAAQVGSGRIAYATDGNGMYTVTADGGAPVLLKSGNARLPRWSPDGSKIAFIQYGGLAVELRVMNADGTDEHVVATGAYWTDIWLSKQPWSGDGTRLAWGPVPGPGGTGGEGDIYTASAAGGDVRRITTDGRWKEPPMWSPTAPQLAYAASVPGSVPQSQLFTARDDGSVPVQITRTEGFSVQTSQPSWSPSGVSIAFVRVAGPDSSIYVVHPDGTELHRVVEFQGGAAGEPVWSPDGSKIVYTDAVNGYPDRWRGRGQEVFVVNADGSGERRLTELAPQFVPDATPAWSPDGDQIVFRRGFFNGRLVTMNSDGTCESALAATAVWDSPSWQALPGGPTVGPKTCSAVALEATTNLSADESAITIVATISNEGTEPLTHVLVTISAARSDLSLQAFNEYGCMRRNTGFVCPIDRIERGESRTVAILGTARRVGLDQRSRNAGLRAGLGVTADGSLWPTGRETGGVYFTPRRCVTLDRGRGAIDGTPFRDRICGRRGADEINPLAGRDVVDAGAGRDLIWAQDGDLDRISCGPGFDRVLADRKDRVARDCERVIRS